MACTFTHGVFQRNLLRIRHTAAGSPYLLKCVDTPQKAEHEDGTEERFLSQRVPPTALVTVRSPGVGGSGGSTDSKLGPVLSLRSRGERREGQNGKGRYI